MLETIFSWLTGGIGEALSWAIVTFLDVLDLSLGVFVSVFPVFSTGYSILQAVSVGLIILIAGFSILSFFLPGLARPRETPPAVLIRAGIAGMCVYFGGYAVEWFVDLAKIPYDVFLSILKSDSFPAESLDLAEGLGTALSAGAAGSAGDTAAVAIGAGAVTILSFLLVLIIAWNVMKLMLEVVERYLMVGFLAYTSPLVCSAMASAETGHIFRRWLSMFFGQCLLMFLSVFSFDIILSGFVFTRQAVEAAAEGTAPYWLRIIMILAMCKIAQRLDSYLQQIGIGAATTGQNLWDDIVATAMTLGRMGRAAGGARRSTPDAPGPGGPDSGKDGSVLGSRARMNGTRNPASWSRFGGVLGAASSYVQHGAAGWREGKTVTESFFSAEAAKAAAMGFAGPGISRAAAAKADRDARRKKEEDGPVGGPESARADAAKERAGNAKRAQAPGKVTGGLVIFPRPRDGEGSGPGTHRPEPPERGRGPGPDASGAGEGPDGNGVRRGRTAGAGRDAAPVPAGDPGRDDTARHDDTHGDRPADWIETTKEGTCFRLEDGDGELLTAMTDAYGDGYVASRTGDQGPLAEWAAASMHAVRSLDDPDLRQDAYYLIDHSLEKAPPAVSERMLGACDTNYIPSPPERDGTRMTDLPLQTALEKTFGGSESAGGRTWFEGHREPSNISAVTLSDPAGRYDGRRIAYNYRTPDGRVRTAEIVDRAGYESRTAGGSAGEEGAGFAPVRTASGAVLYMRDGLDARAADVDSGFLAANRLPPPDRLDGRITGGDSYVREWVSSRGTVPGGARQPAGPGHAAPGRAPAREPGRPEGTKPAGIVLNGMPMDRGSAGGKAGRRAPAAKGEKPKGT